MILDIFDDPEVCHGVPPWSVPWSPLPITRVPTHRTTLAGATSAAQHGVTAALASSPGFFRLQPLGQHTRSWSFGDNKPWFPRFGGFWVSNNRFIDLKSLLSPVIIKKTVKIINISWFSWLFPENHQCSWYFHDYFRKIIKIVKTVKVMLFGPQELTKTVSFVSCYTSENTENHWNNGFSVFIPSHNQVSLVKKPCF